MSARKAGLVAAAVGSSPLSEVSRGKKVSVDPRHTGPRKKRGGWPAVPPSTSFTLWVPNEQHEQLRKLAHEQKTSVGALVRQAITEAFKNGHRTPQVGGSGAVPDAASPRLVRAVRKGDPAPVPR